MGGDPAEGRPGRRGAGWRAASALPLVGVGGRSGLTIVYQACVGAKSLLPALVLPFLRGRNGGSVNGQNPAAQPGRGPPVVPW